MGVVTDLPRGETEDPPAAPDYVEPSGQIVFELAGKQPTSQTLRLYGGKIELTHDQVIKKGDWFELRVIGVVRRQGAVDSEDEKTDQVISCEAQWGLKVKRLEIVGPVGDPTQYEAA